MGYGFILDANKCINCHSCEIACAQENQQFYGYRRLERKEFIIGQKVYSFSLSLSCNHCENPECVRVCPEGLYYKRRDGIVIHQEGLCKGCTKCVQACPYNAPKFNDKIGKVSKCNLCSELLDKGEEPRCVQSCMTGALQLANFHSKPENNFAVLGWEEVYKKMLTQPSLQIVLPKFL